MVATLNSLSPWAVRRKQDAQKGNSIFENAIFRSPDDMRSLAPNDAIVKTAIHFRKDESPKAAVKIENDGNEEGLLTGAFVAARWKKC